MLCCLIYCMLYMLPGIWLIIFIVLPCILYIKYAVLSCILYGGSNNKQTMRQTNKQQTNNTGTEAGPQWLTVLLSCGGGDGSVLRPNVASFITFYKGNKVLLSLAQTQFWNKQMNYVSRDRSFLPLS